MPQSITALGAIRLENYDFAATSHMAYVTMYEFVRAAATYPLVFIEDAKRDEFRPVALLDP